MCDLPDCSICLESIEENLHKTQCNHNFHKDCINQWLDMGNNTCPNCRGNIAPRRRRRRLRRQPVRDALDDFEDFLNNLNLDIPEEMNIQLNGLPEDVNFEDVLRRRAQRDQQIAQERQQQAELRRIEQQQQRQQQRQQRLEDRLLMNGGLLLPNNKVRCTHCNSDCSRGYWNKHITTKKHSKFVRLRGG